MIVMAENICALEFIDNTNYSPTHLRARTPKVYA